MSFNAKKSRVAAPFFFFLFLLAQSLFSAQIIYQEDSTTDFKNPERGMRSSSSSATVDRIYYELGSYKTSNIPQSVFDKVTNDCNSYRAAGRKLIPRFRYYSQSGSDAPLEWILKHIEQLGPVLKANSDVIALFEAGFIGCWGEWHHFGSSDVNNLDNTPARKAILFKELEHWPQDRCIIIRYNNIKRQIFGTDIPLGPDSAFCGSYRARTGAMNDCFRYDASDRGTYDQPPYTESVEFQKTFLNLDNRYVPQEGESCGSSKYSVCDSALKDLKRMHWDILAISSFTTQWASGGCLNKILMGFGYRISLKTANLPDSVRPGDMFIGSINLINKGFGKMFNYRGCELVFKNTSPTGNIFKVDLGIDPRRWCMTESAVNVPIGGLIPSTTTPGSYKVYLNLPDTGSRLRARKEYSIRLANANVWEDATGYNLLNHTVVISPNAPKTNTLQAAPIRGQESFTIAKRNGSVEFILPGTSSTPITLEVFSLSGAKVWSRTVMSRESRSIKWTGSSPGIYLWKAYWNDKEFPYVASGTFHSLMVNGR